MALRADKLRERWESISPRERGMVVALAITFVFVIVAWMGLRINDGLKAISGDNAEIRKALSALHAYRLAGDKGGGAGQEVALSDEPVKLQTYLSDAATEVGIKIPAFTPQTPVTRDDHTETSTRIEVRNLTINQLKDFLEKVESRSRVVVVKSLNVRRHFRDKDKLEVNMVVSTYSKATPEEGDGDKQEG